MMMIMEKLICASCFGFLIILLRMPREFGFGEDVKRQTIQKKARC